MKYIYKQILFLVLTLISSNSFARNVDDGYSYDEISGNGITSFFTSEFTIWWFLSLFIIPLASKILFRKEIDSNFKYLRQLNTKSLIRLISQKFCESWAFGGLMGLFVCGWWVLTFSFIGIVINAVGISYDSFSMLSYAIKVPFPYIIFMTILIHYFYTVFNEMRMICEHIEDNINYEITDLRKELNKIKKKRIV